MLLLLPIRFRNSRKTFLVPVPRAIKISLSEWSGMSSEKQWITQKWVHIHFSAISNSVRCYENVPMKMNFSFVSFMPLCETKKFHDTKNTKPLPGEKRFTYQSSAQSRAIPRREMPPPFAN
jgi:hypothetical protein